MKTQDWTRTTTGKCSEVLTHHSYQGLGGPGEGREKQEERRRANSPNPRSSASFHLSRPNGLFPVDWDLGIHSSSNPREDASQVCQEKEKLPGKEKGGTREKGAVGSDRKRLVYAVSYSSCARDALQGLAFPHSLQTRGGPREAWPLSAGVFGLEEGLS